MGFTGKSNFLGLGMPLLLSITFAFITDVKAEDAFHCDNHLSNLKNMEYTKFLTLFSNQILKDCSDEKKASLPILKPEQHMALISINKACVDKANRTSNSIRLKLKLDECNDQRQKWDPAIYTLGLWDKTVSGGSSDIGVLDNINFVPDNRDSKLGGAKLSDGSVEQPIDKTNLVPFKICCQVGDNKLCEYSGSDVCNDHEGRAFRNESDEAITKSDPAYWSIIYYCESHSWDKLCINGKPAVEPRAAKPKTLNRVEIKSGPAK